VLPGAHRSQRPGAVQPPESIEHVDEQIVVLHCCPRHPIIPRQPFSTNERIEEREREKNVYTCITLAAKNDVTRAMNTN
jgi:hypothetical protein